MVATRRSSANTQEQPVALQTPTRRTRNSAKKSQQLSQGSDSEAEGIAVASDVVIALPAIAEEPPASPARELAIVNDAPSTQNPEAAQPSAAKSSRGAASRAASGRAAPTTQQPARRSTRSARGAATVAASEDEVMTEDPSNTVPEEATATQKVTAASAEADEVAAAPAVVNEAVNEVKEDDAVRSAPAATSAPKNTPQKQTPQKQTPRKQQQQLATQQAGLEPQAVAMNVEVVTAPERSTPAAKMTAVTTVTPGTQTPVTSGVAPAQQQTKPQAGAAPATSGAAEGNTGRMQHQKQGQAQKNQHQQVLLPKHVAPVAAPSQKHQQTQQQVKAFDPWAGLVNNNDSDSDDDDDMGQDDSSDNLMSALAASIKTAFQIKAGQAQNKQGHGSQATSHDQNPSSTTADKQGKDGSKGGDEDDDLLNNPDLKAVDLLWKPEVEVPKQKQLPREVLQVKVTAEKDAGLSKHLTAPSKDPKKIAKEQKAAKPDTAGKGWFDLPAQKIDEGMKRDLRLLRLRSVYDPKRFYKTFDNTKFPKYFAVGTVVEGAAEYYGGRLEASQRRKQTLTEQLLADSDLQHSRKKRFTRLQEEATAHQRVKKRKTDLPRENKSKHRPKH